MKKKWKCVSYLGINAPKLIDPNNQTKWLNRLTSISLFILQPSQCTYPKCFILSLCMILRMTFGQSKHCLGVVYHV